MKINIVRLARLQRRKITVHKRSILLYSVCRKLMFRSEKRSTSTCTSPGPRHNAHLGLALKPCWSYVNEKDLRLGPVWHPESTRINYHTYYLFVYYIIFLHFYLYPTLQAVLLGHCDNFPFFHANVTTYCITYRRLRYLEQKSQKWPSLWLLQVLTLPDVSCRVQAAGSNSWSHK